jgi:hypothetical protein
VLPSYEELFAKEHLAYLSDKEVEVTGKQVQRLVEDDDGVAVERKSVDQIDTQFSQYPQKFAEKLKIKSLLMLASSPLPNIIFIIL